MIRYATLFATIRYNSTFDPRQAPSRALPWSRQTMTFRRAPNTPIYGSSRLVLHDDGRIVEQRDYFDLWGDIFNGAPGLRRPYRSFMRRVFG